MSDFSIKYGKYEWFEATKNVDGSIGFHVSDEMGHGGFTLSLEQVAAFRGWLVAQAEQANAERETAR